MDARGTGRLELDARTWPRSVYVVGLPADAHASAHLGTQELAIGDAGRYVRTLNLPPAGGSQALSVSWE